MKKNSILLFPLFLNLGIQLWGQDKPFVTLPEHLENPEYASWITMPGTKGNEFGVYGFRKSITLNIRPENFLIHVSADNRYRLYVNGEMVSWGPAVGDLHHWNYETLDIADYLNKGTNIISARVWNYGEYRGARQISNRTAFILQGDSKREQIVNTNRTWKVKKDKGYHPISHSNIEVGGGYIAGATDSIQASCNLRGWKINGFDDEAWLYAQEIGKGNHKGLNTWHGTPWLLQERSIPPMEQITEKTPNVLYVKGLNILPESLSNNVEFTVPKHSKVSILLDNEKLTMGFPKMKVSNGNAAKIKIQYQEALFDSKNQKGNRNDWENKTMKGYYDVFISDGSENVIFEPLWIRVFRYIKIEIETRDEALKIHNFHNLFTAYPFRQKGSFSCENKSLKNIWDVSWQTVRLCALESYMDCPYYEQLQYIGDTRIQALISMYVAGDDRLVKNAINQFYNSMQPMGLTKSSHPQKEVQIIPPFSLLYISMIHDYFMVGTDTEFLEKYMPGIRFILDWFIMRIDETGMLGPLPYWNHIDGGTREFKAGSPPGIIEGGSAHMSILLAYTLQNAVEMFEYFDYNCDAENYKRIIVKLIGSTLKYCFDKNKGLIAETPKKALFSQHTNAMAILAEAFNDEQSKLIARKIIQDSDLAQATLYFNFYVFQALKKAGMGGSMLNQLEKWEEFLDYGFTTFPEHGINSRSDCHAWSSHPMYNFLHVTCGIASASPGFTQVQIEPQPGELSFVEGTVAHPSGIINMKYKKQQDGKITCEINLPDEITGTFIWDGKSYQLNGGKNSFNFRCNQ